jgi:hypothetical protein
MDKTVRMIKPQVILGIALFITFLSCNKRQDTIVAFLNEHEQKFDKNKFEIVSLRPVDTIFQDEKYLLRNSSSYVDTTGADTSLTDDDVPTFNPKTTVYSKALYEFITAASYDDEYQIPNKFLNGINEIGYPLFKKKVINDYTFQKDLLVQMRNYDYFNGLFQTDSVRNYLNAERMESNKVLAYVYEFKFRYDHSLKQKIIVFDKDDKTILYYDSL